MRELPKPYERVILVCCNERDPGEDACANRGSAEIQKALKARVREMGLAARCRVSRAMCFGLCKEGPVVCVMPDGVWHAGVGPGDVPAIVERHIRPLG